MRRFARILGTLLVVGGVGTVVWAFVVWRWENSFTSLYTDFRGIDVKHAPDDCAVENLPQRLVASNR